MEKLKEDIIKNTLKNHLSSSSSTDSSTFSTGTLMPSIFFLHVTLPLLLLTSMMVGTVVVLAIGVCVLFSCNKKSFQTVNREQVKEQPIKQRRRSML